MKRFNPSEIEPKWQKIWDEQQTYRADLDSKKPKYFAMSMFNYPSGILHIGHAMNYTISDVMARYKRQQGYESYHPVGWDSFGLPAENRAIKEGVSPQVSMAELIPKYHDLYKTMGWSNDWSKEIATHDPRYYKWTQWIFAEMFKAGLAYQEPRMQWWCEKDNTVLANEQVIDGKCWRHDAPSDPLVEKKEINQWFFKITEYADKMLEATDDLDWTNSVKQAQKNWIGKSVGAEVVFETENDSKIPVFTTRPDTIFGATFLVLAPEHPLLEALVNDDTKLAVDEYVKQSTKKTELERMAETKDKTGVFTGSHAINPATGVKIPIWTADYVLFGYGTGAIMAVPAHDERDFAFAEKFHLEITKVVDGKKDRNAVVTDGILQNSGHFDGMETSEAREQVVAWLEEQGIGKSKTTYKMRDWSVSRQRYWGAPIPIIHCKTCGPQLVPDEQLPVMLPELENFQPSGDGRSALARATDWLEADCPNCGEKAQRETDTLDTYICSSWYFLRYLDPENTEELVGKDVAKKWMPVDFYNGADHATAHLLYARFIARFFAETKGIGSPEPFKKFVFNGKVTAVDGTMFSKSKGNGVDPLEIISSGYGADALRAYLMFAAPVDTWMRWDSQGVPATYRFLNRVWNITQEYLEANDDYNDTDDAVLSLVHPVIKKVTHDLEHQKYNTAIAAMMELTNKLYELKAKRNFAGRENWQFALSSLVSLVAPFAPHMADELWHQLGNDSSVQRDSWPKWDDKYTQNDAMTLAVQVNGKLRGEVIVANDIAKSDAIAEALKLENVIKFVGNQKPTKTIYVPGRLVNIVV
mgnify:CR=1 FL=1